MRELLRFLMDNPILLVILLAWVAGAIGNAARSAKQARERQARSAAPPEPLRTKPRAEPKQQPSVPPARRSPEEVAAEMRRILGMDLETVSMEQERPPPVPVRPKRREVVEPEAPPVPVVPTTQTQHLHLHVDPHVGEGIQRRQAPQSGLVGASSLGTLGGRMHGATKGRRGASRLVNLTDLKRAFVASEILGAPLALRGPNELRGG